jgi:hypothetical protein
VTIDDHYAARANRKQAWAMTLTTATSPKSDAEPITEPITEPSSAFADFVMRRLRYARIQARIALNQIDAVGVALRAGWIGGEDALACLDESGLLDFVITGVST